MDIGRYLSVLEDIIKEQDSSLFKEILNELSQRISENKPQSEIQETINRIKDFYSRSITNQYTPSKVNILNKINGSIYFGNTAYNKLSVILDKNYYNTTGIITELGDYIKEYDDFTSKIHQSATSLRQLGFTSYHLENNIYELGVIIPSDITKDEIKSVEYQLHKWNTIIKAFNEVTKNEKSNPKLLSIDKGSPLQFFIENYGATAACFAVAIERLTAFYKTILEIRLLKIQLEEKSKTQLSEVNKQEKKMFTDELEAIRNYIWDNYACKEVIDGDELRANELKVQLLKELKYIAVSIGKGVDIEVNAPDIAEEPRMDDKESASADEKTEYQKALEDYKKGLQQIMKVKESGGKLKELPPRTDKLLELTSPEEADDEEIEPEEEKKTKKK